MAVAFDVQTVDSLFSTSAPAAGKWSPLVAEAKELLRLSIPIAIAQVALMAMGLVDTAILGHTSKDALAGAGIGRNLGFFAQTLMMGVAIALEPLASQALGAGERGKARAALRGTLKALLLLWPPAVAVAFGLSMLLGPVGVEPSAIPIARRFLMAQAPALLFFTVFLAGKTYLQAHGKTRPALVAAAIANVVNVIACTTLVRGNVTLGIPALGALGSGIAAVFQLFDGVQCVAGGALRGAGDVKFAFAGGVIGYWFVGLPVALALGFGAGMGAAGIWWGLTVGLVSVSIVLTTRFWFMSGRVLRRVA